MVKSIASIIILLFMMITSASAQSNEKVLRGIVLEAETGMEVPFAVVVALTEDDVILGGAYSDIYGKWEIRLPPNTVVPKLQVRYLGMFEVVIENPGFWTKVLLNFDDRYGIDPIPYIPRQVIPLSAYGSETVLRGDNIQNSPGLMR